MRKTIAKLFIIVLSVLLFIPQGLIISYADENEQETEVIIEEDEGLKESTEEEIEEETISPEEEDGESFIDDENTDEEVIEENDEEAIDEEEPVVEEPEVEEAEVEENDDEIIIRKLDIDDTKPTKAMPQEQETEMVEDPLVYANAKNGLIKVDGGTCYYINNVKQKGWQKINDKWYFFDKKTYFMQTGWLLDDGKQYYLQSNGVMATGWLKIDNKWYAFKSNGAMITGWYDHNGKTYYLNDKGVMVTGVNTISKKKYLFNNSGALVKHNTKVGLTYYAIDSSKYTITYTKKLYKEGIDVSEHNQYNFLNGKLKFTDYKNQFVIIRLGWSNRLDGFAERYVEECEKLNIPYGFYIYSYALNTDQAEDEAIAALKNLNMIEAKQGTLKNFKMGIWYDMEDADGWKARNWTGSSGFQRKEVISPIVDTFCSIIQAHGYYCGVYLSAAWDIYLDSSCNKYERWIAHWGMQNTYPDEMTVDVSDIGVLHQYTSSNNLDKNVSYVDISKFKNGEKKTDNLTGVWVSYQSKWKYVKPNAKFCKNEWRIIDGKKYYFGDDEFMVTGWKTISKKRYYFDKNGAMQTGWVETSKGKYFLDANGVMVTGWKRISNKYYYFDKNGVMKTGWLKDADKWYYLGTNGVRTSGWAKVSNKWYYMDKDGIMLTGWLKDGGKWYYLKDSGAMATGWKKVNNKWYYLKDSGAMATGWKKVGDYWYYLRSSGAMAEDTWIDIYHVDASGRWDQTR